MARHVDALVSPTLKNLREQWWDAAFSEFLQETLGPRPGTRILDVGCGDGTAEIALARLRISQLKLFGIDRDARRAAQASHEARAHNLRLGVAAGDVQHLPFREASFDATFCVAVLQHVNDLAGAVRELARVTRAGGRVLAVEPDNSARYWYSSSPEGRRAFDAASRLFAAAAERRADTTDPAVGPRLSSIFTTCGLEPVTVQLFPVSVAHLGEVPSGVWLERRQTIELTGGGRGDGELTRLAAEALETLDRYEQEARAAGSRFVEIQHTMLFATVGQRTEEPLARDPTLPGAARRDGSDPRRDQGALDRTR